MAPSRRLLALLLLALATCACGSDDESSSAASGGSGSSPSGGTSGNGSTGGSTGGGSGGSTASGGTSANAPDPELPGPYQSDHFSVSYVGMHFCDETGTAWPEPNVCWGTFVADVYYPTSGPESGPFPGVIASSGHLGNKDAISWVPEHLATHGYIVLAFSQPYPDQWNCTQLAAGHRGGIDKLIEENASAQSPIHGKLSPAAGFGIMGHSEGGGGALEAGGTDPRVGAIVGLAAWTGFPGEEVIDRATNITAPTLFLVGSTDTINAIGDQNVYSMMTALRVYIEIAGAGHFDWVTGLGPESYKTLAKKYYTLFLGSALKQLAAYEGAIVTESAADQSAGLLVKVMMTQ